MTVDEARRHLEARRTRVCDTNHNQLPKWTITDAHALRIILRDHASLTVRKSPVG